MASYISCNSCNLFDITHWCKNIVNCKWSLELKIELQAHCKTTLFNSEMGNQRKPQLAITWFMTYM